MDRYTPRKLRPLAITSMTLRGLIWLLEYWPVLLVCALFISPLQPYLRTEYEYYMVGSRKIMVACDYLGLHGFRKYTQGTNCPVIVILKSQYHSQ